MGGGGGGGHVLDTGYNVLGGLLSIGRLYLRTYLINSCF